MNLPGFLDIDAYPGYRISKEGVIVRKMKSTPFSKELKLQRKQYLTVNLRKEGKSHCVTVHRLVAKTFVHNPNPEVFTDVNHKDGDKYNNSVDNLEWVTKSQNIKHAYETGLASNRGSRNPKSFLDEAKVEKIKIAIKNGVRNRDLASEYMVHKNIISDIKNGKTWSHV